MAGKMVEFPTNGGTTDGLSRHPGLRQGPGRARDPGVVGPRGPHQERVRPLRGRGLLGAGARHVPRPDGDRARRRRQALHGAQHRAGREGPARAPPSTWPTTPRRRSSARSASAWAASSRSSRPPLNPNVGAVVDFYGIHPNVKPDYAKLSGPVLGLFAEKDGFVTPQTAARRRRGHQEGRQAVGDPHLPGRRPRLLQRRAARRLQQARRRRRLAPHAGLLPPAPEVAHGIATSGARRVQRIWRECRRSRSLAECKHG